MTEFTEPRLKSQGKGSVSSRIEFFSGLFIDGRVRYC